MRWLAVVSLVIVVGCARGPGEAPRPEEPYGLPTGWRYIHGDGRHNSPCLGVVTDKDRPECVVDTMEACSAWQPDWERLQDGAPGYPYGPDWVDGYYPLCDLIRRTPYHATSLGYSQPPSLLRGATRLMAPRGAVVIYRVHGFLFPAEGYEPKDNPFSNRPGDLVVTTVDFTCEKDVAATTLWKEALLGSPDLDKLREQLSAMPYYQWPPSGCVEGSADVDSSPTSATLRFEEGRWWVVDTFREARGTDWPLLEDFYRSIRK